MEAQVPDAHFKTAFFDLLEYFSNYRMHVMQIVESLFTRLGEIEKTVERLQSCIEVQELTMVSLMDTVAQFETNFSILKDNQSLGNLNKPQFKEKISDLPRQESKIPHIALQAVNTVTKKALNTFNNVASLIKTQVVGSQTNTEPEIQKTKKMPKLERSMVIEIPENEIGIPHSIQSFSCFDRSNTGNSLFVDEGSRVLNIGSGALVFLNSKLKLTEKISFEITFNPNRRPAVGLCQVPIALSNNFRWNCKNNDSHFMFSIVPIPNQLSDTGNGIHAERDSKQQSVSVSLNFDKRKQRIFLWHRGEWQNLQISAERFSKLDLLPCIYLPSQGDTASIQSSTVIKDDENEFDFNLMGACIKLELPTRAVNKGNGDIALLSDPITICRYRRFFIRSSETDRIAFGLFDRRVVSESGFKWNGKQQHGCYLFYSNGERLKNGSPFSYSPQALKVVFFEGQSIELQYETSSNKLLCTNLSMPSFGEISVTDICDPSDYFLGVYLPYKDDEVALI